MTMKQIDTLHLPGDLPEAHLRPDLVETLGRIGRQGVGIVMRDAWYIGEAATDLPKISGNLDTTPLGQGLRNRLTLTTHQQRSGDGFGVLSIQTHTKDRYSGHELEYSVITVPRHLSKTEDPECRIPQTDEEWQKEPIHSGLFIFTGGSGGRKYAPSDAYKREIERHARIFRKLSEIHLA